MQYFRNQVTSRKGMAGAELKKYGNHVHIASKISTLQLILQGLVLSACLPTPFIIVPNTSERVSPKNIFKPFLLTLLWNCQVALQYVKKLGVHEMRVLTLAKNRGKGGAVRLVSPRSSSSYFLHQKNLDTLVRVHLHLDHTVSRTCNHKTLQNLTW